MTRACGNQYTNVVATVCETPRRPLLRAKLSKWAHTDGIPSTVADAVSVIKAAYRGPRAHSGEQESAKRGWRRPCAEAGGELGVGRRRPRGRRRRGAPPTVGWRGRVLQLQVTCADAVSSPLAPGIRESSSMSCSSSRATSRMEIPARTDMPIFVCPRCRMDVARRISQTPRNTNRPFYVCTSAIGVRIGAISQFSWIGILELSI